MQHLLTMADLAAILDGDWSRITDADVVTLIKELVHRDIHPEVVGLWARAKQVLPENKIEELIDFPR
jgi:hypothetical protein